MAGELIYICDYKENPTLRASFNSLTETVFGFSLEDWYRHGYWDDQYVCHSFVHSGRVVANVSTSRLRFHIRGSVHKAVQIGTVATLDTFRHQGLAGQLMEAALDKNSDADFAFLFAHQGVKDFYPQFGFRALNETVFRTQAPAGTAKPAQKLVTTHTDHLQLIHGLYERRVPLSSWLGVTDAPSIFMFHCLNTLKDVLYLLPEDDALVVARIDGHRMNVYDIVTSRPVNPLDILTSSTFPDVRELDFYFRPELPGLIQEPYEDEDSILFVRGPFPLEGEQFKFPLTSLT